MTMIRATIQCTGGGSLANGVEGSWYCPILSYQGMTQTVRVQILQKYPGGSALICLVPLMEGTLENLRPGELFQLWDGAGVVCGYVIDRIW